ncbi:hypothetical protein ACO1O0_005416 [Amphichorda felina]
MIVPDNQSGPSEAGEPLNTFYYSPFSLYSILVRFAFELGQSRYPDTSPTVRLRLVNLQEEENLTEEYLTVPVLSSASDYGPAQILEESRDILAWLCSIQPELLPGQHREDIEPLLEAFFAFHAKPLAVRAEERSGGISNRAAAMLERTDINPENIQRVEARARIFIDGLVNLIQRQHQDGTSHGQYIFGRDPTVLDAVATALLARLMDMHRNDLLDDTLRSYALGVLGTDEWRKTTQGRPTIYDDSLGKVADMKLF